VAPARGGRSGGGGRGRWRPGLGSTTAPVWGRGPGGGRRGAQAWAETDAASRTSTGRQHDVGWWRVASGTAAEGIGDDGVWRATAGAFGGWWLTSIQSED
jgi:hypothetical protein